jgi:hypothetical protein
VFVDGSAINAARDRAILGGNSGASYGRSSHLLIAAARCTLSSSALLFLVIRRAMRGLVSMLGLEGRPRKNASPFDFAARAGGSERPRIARRIARSGIFIV